MSTEERRLEELQLDIDLRLTDLWGPIMGAEGSPSIGPLLQDDAVRVSFAALLRVAYCYGYNGALAEAAEGNAGALFKAHGYATPF